MACRSEYIDPTTGDFELAAGDFVEDLTAKSEVILALRTRRGSSAIAPWYGSRIHTIKKLTRVAPKLAEFYAREALQFLVNRGAIRALVVRASVVGTHLVLDISYTDAAGRPVRIPYTHPVSA